MRSVRERRFARTAAGIAGVSGAIVTALLLVFVADFAANDRDGVPGPATFALLLSWPLMAAVYVAARLAAFAPAATEAMERRSLFWPMAAFSLLTPLTLHALVWGLTQETLRGFDEYMACAGLFTIPAHGYLVLLCRRYTGDAEPSPYASPLRIGVRVLAWTTLLGCLPGILLYGIPPLIVFATGLLFIPLMFAWAGDVRARERLAVLELSKIENDAAFARARELVLTDGHWMHERLAALQFLRSDPDRSRVLPVLEIALRSDRPALSGTALIACLDLHHRPPLADVVRLAQQSPSVEVVELLSRYGEERAESEVIDFLSYAAPMRRAAVRALGRMGTAKSIEPLRELGGVAANRAIDRIRSRAAASEGALSLVHSMEGALSPSDRTVA